MSKTKQAKTKTTKKMEQKTDKKTVPLIQKTDDVPKDFADDSLYLDEYTKVRRMSLQLYAPPSQWGTVLLEAEHFAYVYHDKDVNDDGSPKVPHYHLLLCFKSPRYRNGVRKLFDVPPEGENSTINFQKLGYPKRAFQYLMHRTADSVQSKKHLYDSSEVTCDDITFWEDYSGNVENSDFLTDLENLDARSMALRYGRDYIKNYRHYDAFSRMLAEEKRKDVELQHLTLAEACIQQSDDFDELVQDAIGQFVARAVMRNCYVDDTMFTDEGAVNFTVRDAVDMMLAKIEEITYKELKKGGHIV